MTQDEILSAAKEAGCNDEFIKMAPCWIEAFAKIIERKTIERCAVEVDRGPDYSEWNYYSEYDIGIQHGYVNATAAIRKLGEE